MVYECTERVLKYILDNSLVSDGDTIVVGLSGGPDSICLLHILNNIRSRLNINIEAVHVHHGIRGLSADNDETFCIKLCKEFDINISSYRRDIPEESHRTGESMEECARRIRYELFRENLGKLKKGKIAVAHHIDDQAETVLFRMIRGTGVKGLSAMRPQNGDIIRPLLCMSRKEVISYLEEAGLSYCTDETNLVDEYSRNKIRLNIMPEAEKISPSVSKHIADLAVEAAEIADYLDKCSEELLKRAMYTEPSNGDGFIKSCKVDVLAEADRVIVLNAFRKIVNEALNSLKDITRGHIESIYRLLSLTESKSVDLPKNLTVIREGNILRFIVRKKEVSLTDNNEEAFCRMITLPGSVILPNGNTLDAAIEAFEGSLEVPQKIYTKWLDYDKMKVGLCVRFRQSGDYLIVDDNGTKKSLSRYMIDEKIPKSQRDNIPIVACGSEVLWVVGYRISAYFKIGQKTKNIIRLEVKGEVYE